MAHEEDCSPERDGHPRFQSKLNVTNNSLQSNDKSLSSRANILDVGQRQDEQIRRLAEDSNSYNR